MAIEKTVISSGDRHAFNTHRYCELTLEHRLIIQRTVVCLDSNSFLSEPFFSSYNFLACLVP